MQHKFLLGAVSGMSALMIAVPIAAQFTSAASGSSVSGTTSTERPREFSQESVQAMIDRDTAFLKNADTMLVILKEATEKHKNELTIAAGLTDTTAQKAALRAAQENFHTAIQTAIEANPELKGVMMPFGGPMEKHHKFMMRGPAPEKLAKKLGMTADELKAALDSGKTIEQLATEKGITLPTRPEGHMKMRGPMGGRGMMNSQDSATSSAQ